MVCTGNICRSPTAHAVLQHKLEALDLGQRVGVDSAGTFPERGSAPDARSQAVARKRGYELSGIRARALEPQDFERHQLILAMDQGNLRTLVERKPATAAPKLELLLARCPRADGVLEVPDPYYGAPQGFDIVLDMIEAACDDLARQLARQLQS